MSETAPEASPTCYRHPDRETYVRCTRCDRPICPDCMTAASVGFQCPECVREGNKSIRQARTVFGGRVGAEAYVTKALIGINVVLFVAQLASSKVTGDYAMSTYAVAFEDQYYRMITSAFLHSPTFLLHVAFNMYALYAFGSHVERLLGGARYLTLYVVAAFGGSLASLMFIPSFEFDAVRNEWELTTSLGASGAVFGLFGAFFVFARKLRADSSQVLLMIGINLAIGFAVPGINNYAHIGGLVAGAAVAAAFAYAPKGRLRAVYQYAGALLVLVALVVATAARIADLKTQGPGGPFGDNRASASATSVEGAPRR